MGDGKVNKINSELDFCLPGAVFVTEENQHLYGVIAIDSHNPQQQRVNLRKQFWANLNNSALVREMRTREDHQVMGWLMEKNHRDWMGRLDWPGTSGYQMVAF